MGLPQFIAFLNQSNEITQPGSLGNSPRVDGSTYARSRAGGVDGSSTAGTYTALPRPRNSSSATGKRKSSVSSQFTESRLSSQSMTPPETPRSGNGPRMINSLDSKQHEMRIESSLASIPSSGNSQLSTPDTLRRTEHNRKVGKDERNGLDIKNGDRHPKLMSNSASKLPKRTHSLREPSQSSSMPSPRQTRSRMGASRPMSSTNSRKPPSHLVSNVEKDNPRGTTGTALSQNTMAAAYTTLGNSTSKHGTNSEYLLIKPKHGTVNNRTSFHNYILKTITRNYFYTQRCFYNFLNHITQNYHAYNSAA